MDTHIQGPRAGGAIAAVISAIIARASFGDADGTTKLFQTVGAALDAPLFVRISGHIVTAFDGTNAVFTLQETALDGTGAVTRAQISSFSSGKFSLYYILTADKIYNLIFAADEGQLDVTLTDGVSLNADATYESNAANFTAADVGKSITGTNIPAATTILSVTDENTIELSANATGAGTGLTFTIVDREPVTPATAGEAYYNIEVSGAGHPEEMVAS
jgi:hypothetical protein